jgi:DNA-binding transcriptional LysR family regulator
MVRYLVRWQLAERTRAAHPRAFTVNINFRSLRIFCDIVERRSFSRAAGDNRISQSSASQVVHHLEESLGVQLLDRSKRPFVLTPEGERYYEGCRQLVRQHNELGEEVRTLRDETARRLTVASIYSVGLAHMSAFMRRFSAEYPSAQVHLDYRHPHQVYAAVDAGEVDLGLVSYPEESRTLKASAWRSESLVLVCHPQHALAGRESVSLAELTGEPFVAFESDLRIRAEIDRLLYVRKVQVNITHEFDNIEMIKRDIEGGAGLSILPEPTVEREVASGMLSAVAIEGEPIDRPLGILQHRKRTLSVIGKQFLDLLRADGDFACSHTKNGNGRAPISQTEKKQSMVNDSPST